MRPARTTIPPDSTARPIGQLVSNYRIVARLGAGGCGSVWLAEHEVIGTKVAIKILRPEVCAARGMHERFLVEARATAAIASPHVTRYLDIGLLPTGQSYAIMEYLEGESLGERLERGALGIDETIAIVSQVVEALSCAHDTGIVHRDIKPDNIFLGPSVKLLDFGIAKLIGNLYDREYRTQTGMFVGTLAYAAPEQLFGSDVGPAVDVYALGATMFEMLTGAPPVDGESHQIAITKLSVPAPATRSVRPDVPHVLDALVARMLAIEPSERPSIETVREELERLAARGRLARGTVPPESVEPQRLRHGVGISAIALVIATVLLAATRTVEIPVANHSREEPRIAPVAAPIAPEHDRRVDEPPVTHIAPIDEPRSAPRRTPIVAPVAPKSAPTRKAPARTAPITEPGPTPIVPPMPEPPPVVIDKPVPRAPTTTPPRKKQPDVIVADPFEKP